MSHAGDLTQTNRGAAPAPMLRPDEIRGPTVPDELRGFRRFLVRSFLAVVILPSLIYFLYLTLIASPVYETKAMFVLRGDVERATASTGMFGPSATIGALNRTQDGNIIVRFLHSRALLERLRKRVDFAQIFARDDIDWLSRLDANPTAEDMDEYLGDKANASADPLSGIVTLTTHAFTAVEANMLAQVTLEESELMLNGMLDASRADALRIAEQDLQRSREDLTAAQRMMEAFRQGAGVLNPADAGARTLQLIFQRQGERAAIAAELQIALANLSPSSPQVRTLRKRLEVIDAQLAALERELTEHGGREALAKLMSDYDELDLRLGFAERTYARSEMTLLRTQAEIERWHVYLTPIAPPTMAEAPVAPKPLSWALGLAGWMLLLWGIFALLATGTMDHRR